MNRILIIEPDAHLRKAIHKYFAAHMQAVEIDSVNNSLAAIRAADQHTPDAVILELAMAEHNGVAFLQEFRSYADWLQIPVIVYSQIHPDKTGLSSSDWKKYGVVNYYYKPEISLNQLRGAVDACLARETISVS